MYFTIPRFTVIFAYYVASFNNDVNDGSIKMYFCVLFYQSKLIS